MEFTFGFFGYFICTLVLQVACLLAANLVRVTLVPVFNQAPITCWITIGHTILENCYPRPVSNLHRSEILLPK